MPEHSDPELDTSSGNTIDSSVADLGEAIVGLVDSALGLIGDPCTQRTFLHDRTEVILKFREKLLKAARYTAEMNQGKVRGSIRNWGRGYPGATGGIYFETWLTSHETVWNPFPIAYNLVSGRGDERPSRNNSGYRLGPGVYVAPSGRRLQGSRVRAAYDDWVEFQQHNVWSTVLGKPRWQEKLVRWVGRSRNDWRVWLPGDPVDPNSEFGLVDQRLELIREEHEEQSAQCHALTAFPLLATQMQFSLGTKQQAVDVLNIQTDLEKTRLEKQSEQRNLLILAAAGFGLTFLLTQGRR